MSREIQAIAAELHDARFTDECIDFSKARGEFRLACWRPARQARKWIWKRVDLLVNHVSEFVLRKDESVGYYEISTIRYSERTATLEVIGQYAVSIRLMVNRLAVRLEEVDAVREHW